MALSLEDIVKKFGKPKRLNGNSYQCICPSHKDDKASLTISTEGGKILLHCHAGCDAKDILQKVGLTFRDINNNSQLSWKENLEKIFRKLIEAVYDYTDEKGCYLYSKVRLQGKDIRYVVIDHKSNSYKMGLSSNEKKLYNLTNLLKAIKNEEIVYFVEGEKDADTLNRLGLTATTCGSVSDWKKHFKDVFNGAKVVLLPDNDDPGIGLMEKIKDDIKEVCFAYKMVLTCKREKGDVTDYLEEGHTKEELLKLIEQEPWFHKQQVNNNLVPLSDVEDEEVKWLWEPYIPANNISILRGNPGVGKTYFECAIASAVSIDNGKFIKDMPGHIVRRGNVIIFSSEDDSSIIKARVKSCGGDLKKIFVHNKPFSMENTSELVMYIKQHNAKLVIFDPVQAYLGNKTNMNSANEVRSILEKLRFVAREEDCAILITEHLNKATSQTPLNMGIGSKDFVGAARSVLLIGFHPDEDNLRACVQIKTNYKQGQSMGFTILENGIFKWCGTIDITAEEIANANKKVSHNNKISNPVEGIIKAILEDSPTGWSGTATEIMIEGSRLNPSTCTIVEPRMIGNWLSSLEGINTLNRMGIAMDCKKHGGVKKYMFYYKSSKFQI